MTEIRHVEGLYAFWDALVAREPDLWIDNCASGGRRMDLETCSRALVLSRSDMTDRLIWDVPGRATVGMADQVQTTGLSLWVPLHGGIVWGMDPYRFRSAVQAGISLYDDPRYPEFPHEMAVQAIDELKSLRPYFLGDYYLLTTVTTSEKDWCAYQYHRPDMGAGFALYFCRAECETLSMQARLRAIDVGARYNVVLSESYDYPDPVEMSGAELSAYMITVTGPRRALLLRYGEAEAT
jgi:alpha-galactosidase